jgi:hypothetical protein
MGEKVFLRPATRLGRIGFFGVCAVILAVAYPSSTTAAPLSAVDTGNASTVSQASGTFDFAAAGDFSTGSRTQASLARLDQSGVSFFLALGDLDYDTTPTDEAWCEYVLQRLPTLGPTFPFQLVVGNHEEQGGSDGYIMNHAACLPDRLNSTGLYAVEYYFDYPAQAPLMRVIMIPPDLRAENAQYDYSAGSPHYQWLGNAIDSARSAGIPWVVVGMHKNCITTGQKSCEIGADLLTFLVSKRVDLMFQGHEHNYQRSKQLALREDTCPALASNNADLDCIADDGADNNYAKGAGSILVISGSFGQCCYSTSATDPDAPYFAQMNGNTPGFTQFTVAPARIDARFVNSSGTFTDSFSILGPADSDGDGSADSVEAYASTSAADNCGAPPAPGPPSPAWAADLNTGAGTANRLSIHDLGTYIGPVRRTGTSIGSPNYSVRWDMNSDGNLNVQDLALISIMRPPMFGGARAFNGPACTP